MTYRIISLVFFSFFIYSCTSENTSEIEEESNVEEETIINEEDENETENILSSEIQLNFVENTVLDENENEISIPEDATVEKINIYIGESLVNSLTTAPYNFTVDINSFADGLHELKIEILLEDTIIGTKTTFIKIDNNGPEIDFSNINEQEFICGSKTISPLITDSVSDINKVEVFLDNLLILNLDDSTDFTFQLNPENYGIGDKELKFVMEDIVGNISMDSTNISLSQQFLDINFPDGFVRQNVDKVHVILSRSDGSYLGSSTYESGLEETIGICSKQELGTSDEFILTFVKDFQDQIFYFYTYHNLTLENFGNVINMAEISGGLNTRSIEIELPDHKEGDYVRSSGPWSSSIQIGSNYVLSGYSSSSFTNEILGTNNIFIMNFNPDIEQSYRFSFIEKPYTVFKLNNEDFDAVNVVHDNLQINGSWTAPFLSIYGFENEDHFNGLVSHMLYWNPSLNRENNFDYSYANIFEKVFHSIKVSNYSIEGLGHPPSSVTVPEKSIDYTFSNNQLNLNGLEEYNVGRAQLSNYDDAHIFMEMYFDGQANSIIIPEMPEEIFSNRVIEVLEQNKLEFKQCIVEKYEGIHSYNDYIAKIMVPQVPFYLVSPKRERIFKSSVSTSLLPMTEFPFYDRF